MSHFFYLSQFCSPLSLQFESLGPGTISICLVKSVAALSRYVAFCQNNPIAYQVIFENAELAGLLKICTFCKIFKNHLVHECHNVCITVYETRQNWIEIPNLLWNIDIIRLEESFLADFKNGDEFSTFKYFCFIRDKLIGWRWNNTGCWDKFWPFEYILSLLC